MRKSCKACAALLLMLCLCGSWAAADTQGLPNASYNHVIYDADRISWWMAPAAFVPEREYDFASVGGLKSPQDIHVAWDQSRVYMVDTGNNRIIECDIDLNPLRTLEAFTYGGQAQALNAPEGAYLDRYSGLLYVCDTKNHRIAVFDEDFTCVDIYEEPEILLSEDTLAFEYLPAKVLVDRGGRMFVIVKALNKGIMELDEQGRFVGYMGAPTVSADLWQKFLRLFMTAEQKGKMEKFVPTEFDNFAFDDAGFIYAASSTQMGQLMSRYTGDIAVDNLAPIKKLNPKGENVIQYDTYPPMGDIYFNVLTQFVDVVYLGKDVFCALDRNMGRAYAYDGDGQFLYMFAGGASERQSGGAQLGTFKTPIAIERIGECYFILDLGSGSVTAFTATDYGAAIERSANAYYDGDYDTAFSQWQQTLQMNANYHQAIEGMARVLLRKGEYKEALDLFKSIDSNGKYASEAFKQYRKEQVKAASGPIFVGLVAVVALYLCYRLIKGYRKLREEARAA